MVDARTGQKMALNQTAVKVLETFDTLYLRCLLCKWLDIYIPRTGQQMMLNQTDIKRLGTLDTR